MKAQKVFHEFCVAGVGEEGDEAKGLHEVSVRDEDDAAAGIECDEAAYGFASSVEEPGEGFRTGTVDVGGIVTLARTL